MLVTERLSPLRVDGRTVHQVWLPYHWGSGGIVTGDSANDLLGISLDPNVLIQESKVGTCDVRPGRRPTGRALAELVASYQHRSGVYDDHRARSSPPGPAPARTTAATRPPSRRRPEHETRARTACADPSTRPATPATRTTTASARGSSPTPASASAARRARSRARSGTTSPTTASTCSGSSYDNSGSLNANTWRHVAFIEQPKGLGRQDPGCGRPSTSGCRRHRRAPA